MHFVVTNKSEDATALANKEPLQIAIKCTVYKHIYTVYKSVFLSDLHIFTFLKFTSKKREKDSLCKPQFSHLFFN